MFDFAESERAAVAELSRPHAELVPRVHRRIRERLGWPFAGAVARKQLGERRIFSRPGSNPSSAAVPAEKPTRYGALSGVAGRRVRNVLPSRANALSVGLVRSSESAARGPDRPAMLGENDMLSASLLTDIVSPHPRRCWRPGIWPMYGPVYGPRVPDTNIPVVADA